MFDYSLKKQTVNPKKIYAIDMGLVAANVNKIKGEEGHKLENMVYNALRLKYKEIYSRIVVVELMPEGSFSLFADVRLPMFESR